MIVIKCIFNILLQTPKGFTKTFDFIIIKLTFYGTKFFGFMDKIFQPLKMH